MGGPSSPQNLGPEANQRKTYYLATQLDFLRPFVKGNVPPEETVTLNSDEGVTTETHVQDSLPEDEESNDTPHVASPNEVSVDNETEIRQDPTPHKKRKIIALTSEADKSFIEWLNSKKIKHRYPANRSKQMATGSFFAHYFQISINLTTDVREGSKICYTYQRGTGSI